jgi:hypothetical protein
VKKDLTDKESDVTEPEIERYKKCDSEAARKR